MAFGGTIGYDYALLENVSLGLETGINYSPEIATTNITTHNGPPQFADEISVKQNNLNIPILLTFKYYLGNFMINAKGGYSCVRQEFEQSLYDRFSGGIRTNGTTKVSNWKPMVALGIGYEIIDNLSITAQYSAMFGRDNHGNDYNNFQAENWWQPDDVFATYTITAGITYKFGI